MVPSKPLLIIELDVDWHGRPGHHKRDRRFARIRVDGGSPIWEFRPLIK
jgi:hypothetical protein